MWLRLALLLCLIASIASAASVQWNASVVDAEHGAPDGYRVYYDLSSDGLGTVYDNGLGLQFAIPDEWPAGEYYFGVRAYNQSGESGWATTPEGQTWVSYTKTEPQPILPPEPATDVRIVFEPIEEPQMATVTDDFSADTSANYTALTGGISISSGAAHGSSTWATSLVYHETTLGGADQDVSAYISVVNSDSGMVLARYNTSDNTFYAAVINSGYIVLRRYSGTTGTFIASYNGSYGTGTYTIRVVISGTSISVSVNGTERISTTDSTYSTGNYFGLGFVRNYGNADVTVDNVSASSSGGASAVPKIMLLQDHFSGGIH